MAKTLFNVLLPATGHRYDFWVPDDMQMQQATDLISQAMEIAEPDYYKATGNSALMYAPTGEIQNPNAFVAEIGFSDGDKFVLI